MRQVARGSLRCSMAKNASLQKVEPDSTSYNTSCNKNVACVETQQDFNKVLK